MKKVLLIAMLVFTMNSSPFVMAAGDAASAKALSTTCAACHGVDGNSPTELFPKIAGQGEAYLVKQLQDFKNGKRKNAVMAAMVTTLSDQDIADLAAFYSAQKTTPGAISQALLTAGQTVYRAGNKETGLPACMACHGPAGLGVPAAKWPALSGQHAVYIEAQLKSFSSGTRNNDPNSMMRDIAAKMTADEIKAVSAYSASLH